MTSFQATMASAASSGERLPPAELARLVEQTSQRHQSICNHSSREELREAAS